MTRIRVCRVEELATGDVRRVAEDVAVAVYNVQGTIYALDDTCTHEEYPLSEGYVDGDVIECALHMAKYCIRTGKALCYPATSPLCTYPVHVVDGDVFIDVPERASKEDDDG